MMLLFSGEGPTDLGCCSNSQFQCQGDNFLPGPLAHLIDQLFEDCLQYSALDLQAFRYAGKSALVERASELKANPKSPRLPGKKRSRETAFYYSNARSLARIAKDIESSCDGPVVAILFRDADGTASYHRGKYDQKLESMLNGFEDEHFERGVPMLAMPKSEAWILCAVKQKYQNCDGLESRPGNDASPKDLKNELENFLGYSVNRESLNELIADGSIVATKINMPSFAVFRTRFQSVVSKK